MAKEFDKSISIRFIGPVEIRNGFIWLGDDTIDGIVKENIENMRGIAELTLCITPIPGEGLTITTENLEAEEEDHEAV